MWPTAPYSMKELNNLQRKTLKQIKDHKVALVAHSTGSGKTRLGILWRPDLVLAPSHLIPKWRDEANVYGFGDTIAMMSYQKMYHRLKKRSSLYADVDNHYARIVMDEGHALKGAKRMWACYLQRLRADRILFLTATPASIDSAEINNLHDLAKAVTGEREIKFIRDELPPPTLPAVEIYFWHAVDQIARFGGGLWGSRPLGSAAYPAKVPQVENMLGTFRAMYRADRVAIYSSKLAVAHTMGAHFKCPVITGEIKPSERVAKIDEWRASGDPYISFTWQSSDVGFDMPDCDLALVTEVPDTPKTLLQIVGRLRRPGRTEPARVLFYAPNFPQARDAFHRLRRRISALAPYLFGSGEAVW
jgi:superfamily II DNA or RNA helicase